MAGLELSRAMNSCEDTIMAPNQTYHGAFEMGFAWSKAESRLRTLLSFLYFMLGKDCKV